MVLVDKITALLVSVNHPNPDLWKQNEFIQCIGEADNILERLYVNRYWRQWLYNLPINTTVQRFALNDQEEEEEYLNIFSKVVLPLVVEYEIKVKNG